MRASRTEWKKRVQQWQDSGLSVKEYAAKAGLNAHTLENWKYKLRRLARAPRPVVAKTRRPADAQSLLLPLVELPAVTVPRDERIEVELPGGCRLRLPGAFDAPSLRRLLHVLGRRA